MSLKTKKKPPKLATKKRFFLLADNIMDRIKLENNGNIVCFCLRLLEWKLVIGKIIYILQLKKKYVFSWK